MATVKKIGTELRVKLTAREIREAAVDASWAAALDDNLRVSVEEEPRRIRRDPRGGYTVTWALV